MTRLAIRGYVSGAILFEDRAEVDVLAQPEALAEMAERHAKAMMEYPLHMIEIEFLDEKDENERFLRFGTDKDAMSVAVEMPTDLSGFFADIGNDPDPLCYCGQPLHYSDVALYATVKRMIRLLGPDVRVIAGGRTWFVPRHYVALHGLKEQEITTLGFIELKQEPNE